MAPRSLYESLAVAGKRRQAIVRRVESIAGPGQGPQGHMPGQRQRRDTRDGWQGDGRADVRIHLTEHRAVEEVQCQPRRIPPLACRDGSTEQLDIVIPVLKTRLSSGCARPDGGRECPAKSASQRARSVERGDP